MKQLRNVQTIRKTVANKVNSSSNIPITQQTASLHYQSNREHRTISDLKKPTFTQTRTLSTKPDAESGISPTEQALQDELDKYFGENMYMQNDNVDNDLMIDKMEENDLRDIDSDSDFDPQAEFQRVLDSLTLNATSKREEIDKNNHVDQMIDYSNSKSKVSLLNYMTIFSSALLSRSFHDGVSNPDDKINHFQRNQISESDVNGIIRNVIGHDDHMPIMFNRQNVTEYLESLTETMNNHVKHGNEMFYHIYEVFKSDPEVCEIFPAHQLVANYYDYKFSLVIDLCQSALLYDLTEEESANIHYILETIQSRTTTAPEIVDILKLAEKTFPESNVSPYDFIEQVKLEHSAISDAITKYQKILSTMQKAGKLAQMRPAQRFIIAWLDPLKTTIDSELMLIENNIPGLDRKFYGPYLKLVGSAELACIVLHETFNKLLSAPQGIRFIDIALAIGKAVNSEVNMLRLKNNKALWSKLQHTMTNNPNETDVNNAASRILDDSVWSDVIRAKVGSSLLNMLIRVADVDMTIQMKISSTGSDKLISSIIEKKDIGNMFSEMNEVLETERSEFFKFSSDIEHGSAVGSTSTFQEKSSKLSLNSTIIDEDEILKTSLPSKVEPVDQSTPTNTLLDDTTKYIFESVDSEETEVSQNPLDSFLSSSKSVATAQVKKKGVILPHIDTSGQLVLPNLITPAFYHVPGTKGDVGMIKCHPNIIDAIQSSHDFVASMSPRLFPMVIPPRPWRNIRDGGYLTVQNALIRTKGSKKQIDHAMAASLPEVRDSLNKLGRVEWCINEQILPIIERVWNEGGGMAEIPPRNDIPVPPPPAEITPDPSVPERERLAQEAKAMKQWRTDVNNINQYNSDLYSLRCDMKLKVSQAKRLSGKPIYFPVNLDFRGRAYPIPPHLNHLGSDMARGLLLFSNPKPLGERGLYWLYAHLSAQFGVDKVSFDDRVAFARSKWDLIQRTITDPFERNVNNPRFCKRRAIDEPKFIIDPAIALKQETYQAQRYVAMRKDLGAEIDPRVYGHLDMDNIIEPYEGCDLPFDGEYDINPTVAWWTTADSPWQALSTCYEIYAAEMSGDPANFMSKLPVHQDGSCNGLQHYAALGRDELGGSRVNLLPADKPQDVYTHVLNEAKKLMEQDVKDGNVLAKMLLPHVNRKVVKQTVMTSVYGVTFIGARDQVMKQLKDLKDVNWELGFDDEARERLESAKNASGENSDSYKLLARSEIDHVIVISSIYVARLTLASLATVFVGAKSIMTWLAQCATLMSHDQQPVCWVTPLNLPVTQPYRKAAPYTIKTILQSVTFIDSNDNLPVSTQRQKAAFPPNFVHSLDATHMMLTARECVAKGLTFSSVHDSFWTHACDVDTMNISLRDQFVELYTQPILENLHNSFVSRFPHIDFPPLPERGTLDLNEVKKSNYFFS